MRRSVARALTLLYAPSWQRQYGREFEAMLDELPCTATLLADVVPKALATRKQSVALPAAALLLLCISGAHVARPHAPSQVAAHAERHAPALAACLSYSSIARSGIIARRQCLD